MKRQFDDDTDYDSGDQNKQRKLVNDDDDDEDDEVADNGHHQTSSSHPQIRVFRYNVTINEAYHKIIKVNEKSGNSDKSTTSLRFLRDGAGEIRYFLATCPTPISALLLELESASNDHQLKLVTPRYDIDIKFTNQYIHNALIDRLLINDLVTIVQWYVDGMVLKEGDLINFSVTTMQTPPAIEYEERPFYCDGHTLHPCLSGTDNDDDLCLPSAAFRMLQQYGLPFINPLNHHSDICQIFIPPHLSIQGCDTSDDIVSVNRSCTDSSSPGRNGLCMDDRHGRYFLNFGMDVQYDPDEDPPQTIGGQQFKCALLSVD